MCASSTLVSSSSPSFFLVLGGSGAAEGKSAIQRTLVHSNLLPKVANESLVLLQLYRQGTLALAFAQTSYTIKLLQFFGDPKKPSKCLAH